jgi:hypothetical protein
MVMPPWYLTLLLLLLLLLLLRLLPGKLLCTLP